MSYNKFIGQYDYKMNAYDKKYMNSYNRYLSEYDKIMGSNAPSISWNTNKVTKSLSDKMLQGYLTNGDDGVPDRRSNLDRFFDAINVGQYTVQGAMSGIINDDEKILDNIWKGLKGANPFGSDYKEGEFTFSDNLADLGWKPDTKIGKVAKFTLGLAGDILLDPVTYLSGGVKPLLKGSGKAGQQITQEMAVNVLKKEFGEGIASKGIKEIPKAIYDEIIQRGLKHTGINKELFERLAIRKSEEASKFLFESIGMSDDLAKTIVRRVRPGIKGDELARESAELARRYNSLYGLNKNPFDLMYSLQNMPFGNKLFPNAKFYKIGSAESLAKIGDYTFAPIYHGIRSKIKASQIGKMFDTSSDIYKIAKSNPEELYRAIRHVDIATGFNRELINSKESIMKFVNEISELTPEQNKTLLEVLQDKKMFEEIKRTINIIDTDEAQEIAMQLHRNKNVLSTQLEEMIKTNATIDYLKAGEIDSHIKLSDAIETLKKQKRDIIDNIKIDRLSNQEGLAKYIDEVEIRRNELKSNLKASEDLRMDKIRTREAALRSEINEYNDALKKLDKEINNLSKGNLPKSKKNIKTFLLKEKKELDAKIHQSLVEQNKIKKVLEKDYTITDILDKRIKNARVEFKKGTSRNLEDYFRLTDDVSEMLTGRKGLISKKTHIDDMDSVISMFKNNVNPDIIVEWVNSNPKKYGGAFVDYYQNIAKRSGYTGSWKNFYYNSDAIELRKLRAKGKLDFEGYLKLAKLEEVALKRDKLISETRHMSLEDALEYFRKIDVKDMNKGIDDKMFNRRFLPKSIEEANSFLRDIEAERFRKGNAGYAGTTFDDFKVPYEKKSFVNPEAKIKLKEELPRVKQNIIDLISKGNPTAIHVKYADDVANKYSKIFLDSYGKGISSDELITKALKATFVEAGNKNPVAFGELNKIVQDHITKHNTAMLKRHIADVKDNLKEGFEVTFKKGDDTLKGVLSTKRIDAYGTISYSVKVGDKYISISPRDVLKYGNSDFKKIEDVFESIRNNFIDTHKMKLETHFNEMNDIKSRLDDVVKRISDLDKSGMEGLSRARESYDEIFDIKSELTRQADELKAVKRIKTTPEIQSLNKELSSSKSKLKYQQDRMLKEIEETTTSYDKYIAELQESLVKTEKAIDNISKDAFDVRTIEEVAREMEKIDRLFASTEAMETYIKSSLGENGIRNLETTFGTGRLVIEDIPMDEKVKKIAINLRNEFIKIGKDEVSIHKLKQGQLDALMFEYVPHMLTPEGYKFVKSSKEFEKYASALTTDYGYGRVKNPHSLSRTIKSLPDGNGGFINNPTIEQINNFFSPHLKGKNLFSENVAEIYMARAMKHNELMYDNKYMYEMLNQFGTKIDLRNSDNFVPRDGFKPVVNYGHLKDNIREVAVNRVRRLKVIKIQELNSMGASQKEIDNVIKGKEWFEANLQRSIREVMDEIKLNPNVLDEMAVPMVELKVEQVKKLHHIFKEEKLIQQDFLSDAVTKAKGEASIMGFDIKDPRTRYLNNLEQSMAKAKTFNPVEIYEVNEAIVNKANQMRKLQILKDQSNFLKVFDKATYFIKLNQTTVMPSFHARNASSNVFLQYLGIGNRAFDMDLKKKAYQMAKNDGKHKVASELISFTDELGKRQVKSLGELWQEAKALKVVDSGVFAQELGASSSSRGVFRAMNAKLDPTDTGNFFAYKKGAEIGSIIEHMDRFMFFVANVESGKGYREARDIVHKYMVDYGDVTPFEQTVMKRIIPYYTWMKKNAGLQLSEMVQNPKKYLGISKITRGIENITDKESRMEQKYMNNFALDWIQTPFKVRGKWGNKETVMWNPALPYMDISKYPITANPLEFAKALTPSTNPLLKVPTELILNKNTFFDSPIVKEGDNPVGKRLDYALSQTSPYTTAKGFVQKSGADLGLHTLNTATGIRLLSYDYDSYKKQRQKDALQRKRESMGFR